MPLRPPKTLPLRLKPTAPVVKPYRPRPGASPSGSARQQAPLPRNRRIHYIVGGGALGLISFYVCFLGYQWQQDISRFSSATIPSDTSTRYNFIADEFDSSVNLTEQVIGISRRRKELCSKATGHVLEASVGTGRNMTVLPLNDRANGVKSVTMVDKSREMLDVARLKWPECGNAWFIHALFRVADLSAPNVRVPVPRAASVEAGGSGKFDTVLQTMGLCSTGEPVRLLQNLGAMCEPQRGRILLLEHGKSHYNWLNNLLDKMAPGHAHRYGCWFNKDIGAIVRESGLEIVEERRFNAGTTWWFVLKPPAQPLHEPVSNTATETNADKATPAWWWSWGR